MWKTHQHALLHVLCMESATASEKALKCGGKEEHILSHFNRIIVIKKLFRLTFKTFKIIESDLTSRCPPSSGGRERHAATQGRHQGWRSLDVGWLGGQQRGLPGTQRLTFAVAAVRGRALGRALPQLSLGGCLPPDLGLAWDGVGYHSSLLLCRGWPGQG